MIMILLELFAFLLKWKALFTSSRQGKDFFLATVDKEYLQYLNVNLFSLDDAPDDPYSHAYAHARVLVD